ncbi:hypothetical protein [Neolewinella antarctica]|uniref:Uncharacterized protein n=1 Tax=Neolewinella antarctica TaxID=442734 RepID=A0ABX0XEB9_9BACT|nr:hypothetical protein [Neolewinella antarctica]NJC27630.1 hypothetical protein [Neolewinella antarctica]
MTSLQIYRGFKHIFHKLSWPVVRDKSEYIYIGPFEDRNMGLIKSYLSQLAGSQLLVVVDKKRSYVTDATDGEEIAKRIAQFQRVWVVELGWRTCVEIKGEVMRIGYSSDSARYYPTNPLRHPA